jgi:hypothetical protein
MSKTYNYQTATVQEVAERFRTISNQAYSKLLAYYSEDNTMSWKLQQARHLSKIICLQSSYDEIYGVGLEDKA